MLFKAAGPSKPTAVQAIQSIMLRLLAMTAPGKLRFTFIDPVGLGQNVAAFMHLADHDEALVTSRAWTEPRHIEQRLADLSEHMENVIQKYLRNEYATIEAYNAQAGELAEPYRALTVLNFPVNFTDTAARRLVSIAQNGPRCGVYTLITVDTQQPLPHGFNLDDLERTSTVIAWNGERFVWEDDDFRDCTLELDTPPDAELFDHIVSTVGKAAAEAGRVEVPFERIAPAKDVWWTETSDDGLRAPLGLSGARRQQYLDLGHGTAQHALVGGKTGAGKSTLLHALITNLALSYSPEEVELYLIDFKKGVEFKTYATNELPHARVVAIESEREFGLSVLEGLDAELKQRGDLFRGAGVDHIADYRQRTDQTMPRILLLVDEFQEFFTEDDRVATQASQVLDRLVRQGRAFGIHVLLGSQTLSGTYTLSRSTIDQMAVRIALQCSEADSRLILADDNPAARLLSRPGEAIYNDANGLVEGNNPFQVAWLPDDKRDRYVAEVRDLAEQNGYQPPQPQIVFEGNAPAEVRKNRLLQDLLETPSWPAPSRRIPAWLGEPIAIKDPTVAHFRRQTGSNLLIVGQNDEAAMGMLSTAMVSLAAQHPPSPSQGEGRGGGTHFYVIDFSSVDAPYARLFPRLGELLPHTVQRGRRRKLPDIIAEIAGEVDERLEEPEASLLEKPAIYLFVYGLHRARDLRQEDDFGLSSFGYDDEPAPVSPAQQFATILQEGPDLGVHTLVWCNAYTNLTRTLDRRSLREFEMRVAFQMSAEDSANLIDVPAASKLGPYRALFYSEEEVRMEKFRPYSLPSDEWLTWIGERMREKEPTSDTMSSIEESVEGRR
ncbi:MAG: ESX secretion system protein EccC [Anaerolineales bacterium]|nr:ESX secretion system protein EccC [Anaerolineales bacterium]